MAYMSQEKKANIAPVVKAILKKYGVKGSLSVRHYSTLVLTIKEGSIDFIGNYAKGLEVDCFKPTDYMQVNTYWIDDHFSGTAKEFLVEMKNAMDGVGTNEENFDKSDIQSDYFHVGWYVDINVGKYDKPYNLKEAA
jgi:hypothetical protein